MRAGVQPCAPPPRDAESAQRLVAEAKTAEAGAKLRAGENADEAATNSFLLDDLLRQVASTAQADARHQPDPDLTVRAALDRAGGSVGECFPDRPAKASEQCRAALDSCRAHLGPSDRETLAALGSLASANGAAGSVALYEECLRLDGRVAPGPAGCGENSPVEATSPRSPLRAGEGVSVVRRVRQWRG